jgi:hypothetical protein
MQNVSVSSPMWSSVDISFSSLLTKCINQRFPSFHNLCSPLNISLTSSPFSTWINSNKQILHKFQLMNKILFKSYCKLHWILSYRIIQASHNSGRELVSNIGPVNEYEAQISIIPFVGIIIREVWDATTVSLYFYQSACCDTERKLTLAGDKMCCL